MLYSLPQILQCYKLSFSRRDAAKSLFARLQSSDDKATRKVAQQMLFQEQASSFLKLDESVLIYIYIYIYV